VQQSIYVLSHTHCNTLQDTVRHCNTLQHSATIHIRLVAYSVQDSAGQYNTNAQKKHLKVISLCIFSRTHCNALQRTATRCNTLQHTATHLSTKKHESNTLIHFRTYTLQHPCNIPINTLQHPATYLSTHCTTLQHTATHCNTLQTHLSTKKPESNTLIHFLKYTLQHPATCLSTHCSTLQHTATHCNTLQHTATHYNTPINKKT